MYENFSKTICFGDLKQAALYYDHVVPLLIKDVPGLESLDPKNTIGDKIDLGKKVLRSLFMNDEEYAVHILSSIKVKGTYTYPFFNLSYNELLSCDCEIKTGGYNFYKKESLISEFGTDIIGIGLFCGSNQMQFRFNKDRLRIAVNTLIDEHKISRPNVLYPRNLLENDKSDEVLCALNNVELIDTGNASWEQIIAIRDDSVARNKLTKLRLFLSNNYVGKSRNYIEDDLMCIIGDYNSTVKAYGFDTVMSTLSLVTKSNNMISATAISMLAIMMGVPQFSIDALAAGATLEISNIAITIAQNKYKLNNFRNNHDLAYIIEVNEQFNK